MTYVIYKGEKIKVHTAYQQYGLGRTPLKCIQLRNRGINSIDEIEGLLELKGLQSLDLMENKIASLSGLEELTNLKILMIGNRISEIKNLDKLTKLTHLWLGSEISEIKGLDNLSNLLHLTLRGKISEIDNISSLTKLIDLDLNHNQISEIKGLGDLTNLERLHLGGNQISEIKELTLLKKVFDLDLSSNEITEIKGLSHLKMLSSLDLNFNKIKEIKGLEGLTEIWHLDLSSNKITEIKNIDSLSRLQELYLGNNNITSIKGIENLPGFHIYLYPNPIPEVEMKRFKGYINGNFIIHSYFYGDQILILFNNSHKKLNNKSYEFSIYCRNINEEPPSPKFTANLHLINPLGEALQTFQMNSHPSDLQHPDYDSKKVVKFHISIDLETLCDEEGLWHYFFTLKDESDNGKVIFIPENGYLLGPEITSPEIAIFIGHSVSSIPGKRYIRAGFLKNNYEFIVDSFYWKDLKEVYLCLIPAQKTEGIGISNTVGIKKFKMKLFNDDSNSMGEVGFRYIINFEDLQYKAAELGWFSNHYEGILKDGTKVYHYSQKSFYSRHEDAEFSDKDIWEDFKDPFVANNQPQLVDYIFEDTKHLIYSPSCFLDEVCVELEKKPKTVYEVKFDYTLRFEVLYSDSNGYKPFKGYPRLIFRNKELDKNYEYIMVINNVISRISQYYGKIFESYICDVNWANFPEGTWNFYFEAKDSKGKVIRSLLGKETIERI
jgi:Leucine-rich repeat (LRR) protein